MTADEIEILTQAKTILADYWKRKQNVSLSSWNAASDYCELHVRGEVEHFHALFLDRRNRLIEDCLMSVGTVDHVMAYPREIVKRGLELGATAVILAHNHPSGDPTPSDQDIKWTKAIKKACQCVDIILHDHLIVGEKVYSLRGNRKI
jgi:DNA repair protein RadC